MPFLRHHRAAFLVAFNAVIAAVLLALNWPQSHGTSNVPPAQYYEGAVIRWIVPNAPGGGYDRYSRLIAPYVERVTGARVEIVNLPGAGGMRGLDAVLRAAPNGLTIGLVNGSGLVHGELAGLEGADRSIGKLSLLARVGRDIRVLAVAKHAGLAEFDELFESSEKRLVGATGIGGSTYLDAVLMRDTLGLDTRVIHGFVNSPGMRHAMLAGVIDGSWGSWGSNQTAASAGQVILLAQGGRRRSPSLPDIPTVWEFADRTPNPAFTREVLAVWESINDVGRVMAGPPGIPADRLAFLREAFHQALSEAELLAAAERIRRPVSYLSGEELGGLLDQALDPSREVRETIAAAVRSGIE